ncbi:MAG: NAD(P)-dependent alcohol dehydrogenase [Deltaproteobacteria bacterium]|nr:NAD(P)-dependent alcohol dehydrogenase [Deltaproteobacteria bacterium]
MATMRALAVASYGKVDALRVIDVPLVAPGPGQIRVRVHTSAVNPADGKVVTGAVKMLHGRQFPLVPGYDFSGVVESLGPGAFGVGKGDEVFGCLAYGGKTKVGAFAEYVITTPEQVGTKPAGVDHSTAAAAATVGLTALQALRDKGRVQKGTRVLVIGASGGVGTLAIGIAKRLGAVVTGVCSAHAVNLVKDLGADRVIDRRQHDPLAGDVLYDVIFDAAAAHSYAECRHALSPKGVYVTTLPSLALAVGLVMSVFAAKRCAFVMVASKRADLEALAGYLAHGLKVPIDSTVPARDVAKGIKRMDKGAMRGRIVVDVLTGL